MDACSVGVRDAEDDEDASEASREKEEDARGRTRGELKRAASWSRTRARERAGTADRFLERRRVDAEGRLGDRK